MIHQPRARRSRVVLIGVSEYDRGTGYPSLPSVLANIEQLYDVLVDDAYGRFTPEVVRTVRSPDRETLVREAARAAGEAEDLLLCYFSGHGCLYTSEPAQGPGRLYLLPRAGGGPGAGTGAYGLGYAELRDLLCAGRAERVVLVLDCCYSGNALLEPLPEDRAFALLTSSRRFHGQGAGDGSGPTPFTAALLEVLRGGGDGEDERGPVTVEALAEPLRRRAERDAERARGEADSDPDDWHPELHTANEAGNTVLSQAVHLPRTSRARRLARTVRARRDRLWARARARPVRAAGALGAAVLAGAGLLLAAGAAWQALHPPPPDCPIPLELRVLTSPEHEQALTRVLAAFEDSAHARAPLEGRPAGCRQLNAFVYAAPDGDTVAALAASAAWAEPERGCAGRAAGAGGQECAAPLRDIGPRPDAWLPGSPTAVRRVADAVAAAESAVYLGEGRTVATSPAVVLMPGDPGTGVRRSGEPLERLLAAAAERGWPVLRAQPATSGAALLFGMAAGPGAIPAVPLPPRDDAALLCALARPAGAGTGADAPAPVLLVAERTAADLIREERRPACLGGAAGGHLEGASWDERYRAYYPGDVPRLDLTYVPVHWERAGADDAGRRTALARLGEWLGSDAGRRALGREGFRDPDDERRALIDAPPLNHGAFVAEPGPAALPVPGAAAVADYLREEENRQPPRDVVFVVDVSSGSYTRASQYEAVLRAAIGVLGPEDRFALLATPGGAGAPFRTLLGLGAHGADRAGEGIGELAPVERFAAVTPAVEEGLRLLAEGSAAGRGRLVVLLTDDQDSSGWPQVPAGGPVPLAVVSYGPDGCEHAYNRTVVASGGLCFDSSGAPGVALAGTLRVLTAPQEP
ncbi:substrate-binding domain-containing protein [Streptomyces carpaticus]|uniref:hypothetical protein n=1 Tax=Streptomyces carpaticus TaxID=285558 RepID=UPI0022081915|nr:substrate-binding domain-containing protein [Streptomyces carpaticus]